MSDGLDLHDELAGGVRDASGAWRFVRVFAGEYATAIADGDGFAEEELSAAEARLGFGLPRSLRQAYAMFGKRRDLTSGQDLLLGPHRLGVDDTGHALVFRVEAQHVTEWGIPLSAVGESDPPVEYRVPSAGSGEWPWQPFLERFSLAAVEMVLSEWLLGADIPADNRHLDDVTTAALRSHFRRLPMPEYPLWAGGGPITWWEGHGAVLRADADTWLWAGAASQDAIAAVRRVLPGEWLMDDGASAIGE